MGRIEILTGIERRRGWSDDDKLSILEEAAVEGARIVDVARRHDIHPQQILQLAQEVRGHPDQPGGFVPACGVDLAGADQ